MTRRIVTATLATLLVLPIAASAEEGEEMTTRVYRVADLIRRVPDYPYESGIPTTEPTTVNRPGLLSTGNPSSGGGGFGGGGAGGGGFFQLSGGGSMFGGGAANGDQSHELSLKGLIDVITTSIAPDTWRNSGTGEGTITALGTSLVVRQFPAIQDQITELLAALREQSDFHKMLTVEVFLLPLSPDDELAVLRNDPDTLRNDQAERETVMARIRTQASYSGQLTCFSGQQVHLASGRRRSAVTSAVPVVSALAVGYQPVISTPHIGTLVEMTPTLSQAETSVTVDLRCTLTEWKDDAETMTISSTSLAGADRTTGSEGRGGQTTVEIQQLNIGTRQLATSVRVPATPTGVPPIPVLVGTLGEPTPSSDEARFTPSTYLVLAVSQNDGATRP